MRGAASGKGRTPLAGPGVPTSPRCLPGQVLCSASPYSREPGRVGLERGGAEAEGRAEGGTMAPSSPLAGWRVGSPRPASPLLPRQGDEVIAPPRGTRSRCPARSAPVPLPRRSPPLALSRPRPPGRIMTERCSLWSALSAAACCFYRGSFVQVQVRGWHGPRQALGAGTPGRSATGPGAGSCSAARPRRV